MLSALMGLFSALIPDGISDEIGSVREILVLSGLDRRQSLAHLNSIDGVASVRSLSARFNGQAVRLGPQAGGFASLTADIVSRIFVVRAVDGFDVRKLSASLERHPGIEVAEPDFALRLLDNHDDDIPRVFPDDLQLGTQWHLNNPGEIDGSLIDSDIDAPEAWHIFTGDPDFMVAVIDTGADFFHPDLEDNIWVNSAEIPGNGVDDDRNGYIDDIYGYDFWNDDSDPYDDNGHGTHVSGIIGAKANNQIGIAGVAWNIRIMALKTFDERGNGNTSLAIDAIEYAVSKGARIINASWGADEKSRILEQVIIAAREDGVLTIAAAGNDRSTKPNYPAYFDSVISVAALDFADNRSDFSNHGPTVDIAAPGTGIFSAKVNNAYGPLNGTSMATPIVAGVAALVWGRHPEFSLQDVENIILSTADKLTVREEIGSGRVNAYNALQVNEPIPTARLNLPTVVSGRFDILGTASGETLTEYILEIGESFQPRTWREIYRGRDIVVRNTLLPDFSTADLAEGDYSIRLRARNSQGKEGVSQKRITVNNVNIISPDNNDFLRHGGVIPITGNVFGLNRTFTLEYGLGINPTQWLVDGIEPVEYQPGSIQNDVLAHWDTSQLEPDAFYALRLTSHAQDGGVDEEFSWLIYFDSSVRNGWPKFINTPDSVSAVSDWKGFKLADLDGDGDMEVITVRPGDEEISPAQALAFDHLGEPLWEKDLSVGRPFGGSVVVGQMHGDTRLEVVVSGGGDGRIHVLDHDGKPVGGSWPVRPAGRMHGMALADINGDGLDDLITLNNESFFIGSRPTRRLSVYDSSGRLEKSWDMADCFHEVEVVELVPAVADLDGDGVVEIVVPVGCSGLGMFDMGSNSNPVWVGSGSGQFITSPVIADLDGDSSLEIVASAYDEDKANRGGIYVFRADGKLYSSFPVLVSESFVDAPILADIDNDKDVEIIVNSRYRKQIHVLNHDGFNVDGWPTSPLVNENFRGQPTVGDLDGDGLLEVIAPVHGLFLLFANTGDPRYLGGVRVYDHSGQPVRNPYSPVSSRSLNWFHFPSAGAESSDKNHLIQLNDIDGDGQLDLLLSSVIDASYVPNKPSLISSKDSFTLYGWSLPVPYEPSVFPWPSYQGSISQQGFFLNPPKPNKPPQFAPIPSQIAAFPRDWIPVNLLPAVSDPDHESMELIFSFEATGDLEVRLSERAVLSVSHPDPDWQGVESVLLTVTDPRGGTDSLELLFTADNTLDFPEALPDLVITDEDVPVEIDVLANDRDVSGDVPRLVTAGPAESGQVRVLGDGIVVYIPRENFFGTDSFPYTIVGEGGGQSIGLVNITVGAVNDAPIAVGDRAILDEDTQVQVFPLVNDIDPENDPVSLVSVDDPRNGTLSANGDGSFTFIPTRNFSGEETVEYRVRDSQGLESIGYIFLIVRPVNDPPVASDIKVDMNRNTIKSIVFKANDLDGDPLEYEVVKAPENGNVLAFPTVAEYSPAEGFIGVDTFTYRATDKFSQSQEATVTITVLDRNNPPRARNDSAFTLVNQPLIITLTAEDLDGDEFDIIIDEQPANGVIEPLDEPDTFRYISDEGFAGEDKIIFHARDQEDDGPSATFRITVTDENTPPRALDQFVTTRMDVPVEFQLDVFDREGTPLRIIQVEGTENGRLEINGTSVTYTPDPGYLGVDRLIYRASDGVSDSRRATVFFRVRFPNDEPVVTEKKIIMLRGQTFSFDLPVSDPDEDVLRSAIAKGPKNGRVYGQGIRYTYRPDRSFVGTDSFTFRSWDGRAYSSLGVIEIEVRTSLLDVELTIDDFLISLTEGYDIKITSVNGTQLSLDFSTDLKVWTEISTLEVIDRQARFTGQLPETDGSPSAGFFRVRVKGQSE